MRQTGAMPTRRQVVAGLGSLAGVAALSSAGWIEIGATRREHLLHRLGLASSPDRSVPPSGTPLVSGSFVSVHMPRPVEWTISTPPQPAGVVYCLHGKDDDHRFAFDTIHLHDFMAAGQLSAAVAACGGGPDSYWHQRADGSNAMAMLLSEFIPMIDRHFGTSQRAVLGWSMGGYGALLAAETAPPRFKAALAASAALWTSPGSTAPGAFDGPADFYAHDVFRGVSTLANMVIRIDCGTGDPFYPADRTFAASLPSRPQGGFVPGFHDAAYWRSLAPGQVATLKSAIGSG